MKTLKVKDFFHSTLIDDDYLIEGSMSSLQYKYFLSYVAHFTRKDEPKNACDFIWKGQECLITIQFNLRLSFQELQDSMEIKINIDDDSDDDKNYGERNSGIEASPAAPYVKIPY